MKSKERNMSIPQISIIMPIYNTPIEYLKECLDSVFAQTFTDFELICVDDKSDDETTKALIDAYENRHKNMRVIHLKERSGAAIARNTGFSHAKSEYVIFLDADDIFEKNFLMEMYQCIEENQADFCACGYTEFYSRGQEKEYISCKLEEEGIINKDSDTWLMNIAPVPWNKLCRRHFLSEYNICFQSIASHNDVFFHCMCMICAKKLCILEKGDLIFYRTGTKRQISANGNPVNIYEAITLFLKVAPNYYSGDNLWNWSGSLLILIMLNEISINSNVEKNKEVYLLVRKFFKENPISFKNRILQAYQNNILQLDYESNWYSDAISYVGQLRLFSEEIKFIISKYRDIYVWGRGKRGEAFQQFCKEEGIALSGVADRKDSDIGKITRYGNIILGTWEIMEKESGCIVASNRKIYGYLNKNVRCFLLDLEEFCPI